MKVIKLFSALVGMSAMASVALAAPMEDSVKKDAAKQPMVLSSVQMDVVTAGNRHQPRQQGLVNVSGVQVLVAAQALTTDSRQTAITRQ